MSTLPAVVVTGTVIETSWGNDVRTAITENPAYLAAAQADLFYSTGAGALARLAKGTARQALLMNAGATAPEWGASLASVLTATGDLPYASAANTPARLPIGTPAQMLRVNAGGTAPEWVTVTADTPVKVAFNGSNGAGSGSSLALSNHQHQGPHLEKSAGNTSATFTYATAFGATPAVSVQHSDPGFTGTIFVTNVTSTSTTAVATTRESFTATPASTDTSTAIDIIATE